MRCWIAVNIVVVVVVASLHLAIQTITNKVYTARSDMAIAASVVWKTVSARSPIECIVLCTNTENCHSCNYHENSGDCDFSSRDNFTSGDVGVVNQEGTSFYHIVREPKDCNDIEGKGLFKINITGFGQKEAYCDNGWVTVMRRYNQTEDFHRNWNEYKSGFGDPRYQFWFGNEALYSLTNQGNYSMQMDVLSCNGNYYYVRWNLFRVQNEANRYAVDAISLEAYNTSTNSDLVETVGWPFGTYDMPVSHCSTVHGGGWWFKDCTRWHLTGHYPVCGSTNIGMKMSAVNGTNCDAACVLQAGTIKMRRND